MFEIPLKIGITHNLSVFLCSEGMVRWEGEGGREREEVHMVYMEKSVGTLNNEE